jgi:hypothetical protein
MPNSVRVKWRLSPFNHVEITINDVLGEVTRASGESSCEAQGEHHSELRYSVMATCAKCSRSFAGDKCTFCDSDPQLVLHDSTVRDTGPWWAQPTDFVGWRLRIGLFLLVRT